ncbi:MAG: ribonuclease HI family protein [Phycisphaeraceae bacterium]
MRATLQTDGGSRGNPGPAGAGVVLVDDDGTALAEAGYFLGRCTNNVAEYRGLIRGLELARSVGVTELLIRLDSELIVKQLLGEYRVKSADLKPLFAEAKGVLGGFSGWRIEHVRREGNRRADELANLAMDAGRDVVAYSPLVGGKSEGAMAEREGESEGEERGRLAEGSSCRHGQAGGVWLGVGPRVEAGWCVEGLAALLAARGRGEREGICGRCGGRVCREG